MKLVANNPTEKRRLEAATVARGMVAAAEKARRALARLALPSAWTIRVPDSQDELVREGREMGNCIGSGTYSAEMAAGRCVCIVIAGPGKVRADVQIAQGRVRQCYGPRNSPPHEVAREIATRAARALRRAAA